MRDDSQLTPCYRVNPCIILSDERRARHMTWKQLRDAAGFSLRTEIGLRTCCLPITPEVAEGLEKALGIDAEMWLNLQAAYDQEEGE